MHASTPKNQGEHCKKEVYIFFQMWHLPERPIREYFFVKMNHTLFVEMLIVIMILYLSEPKSKVVWSHIRKYDRESITELSPNKQVLEK